MVDGRGSLLELRLKSIGLLDFAVIKCDLLASESTYYLIYPGFKVL